MSELHLPWLELAIIAPLLAALGTLPVRDRERVIRQRLAVSGFALACAVAAWLDFISLNDSVAHDRWSLFDRLLGAEPFVIDQVNAPLIPLAALVCFLTALATPRTKVQRFSFGGMLVSQAILTATFSSREPLWIVVLLIAGLAPPLIELRARRKPLRIYAIHALAFAACLAAGGWLAYGPWSSSVAALPLAVALVAAAVVIRCGAFPFHCWMTDLFEHATFGTALLFATPMVGVYAAVRLLLPIASDDALHRVAMLSLFTAFYAAGMALVQRDSRRFFCFLFLSHSSLVLVGFELATPIGLTGALWLWVSVGLSLTGFGLTLRAVEARIGRVSLDTYHGLYEHAPLLGGFFLLTALASIGFPGTIGFVGAELLLEGVVHVSPLLGLVVVAAGALAGISVLQAYFRVFTGKRYATSISLRSGWQERLGMVTLTALILGGGLIPQPGLVSRRAAAAQIIHSRRAAATSTADDGEHARWKDWLAKDRAIPSTPTDEAPYEAEATLLRK